MLNIEDYFETEVNAVYGSVGFHSFIALQEGRNELEYLIL